MTFSGRLLHKVLPGSGGLALALALSPVPSFADSPVNTGYFGGVAIMGYDTVAYFTEGKAVKGSADLAHDWLGATWNFATAEHKELFSRDPDKYAPQYGGFCALGAAFGESTSNIDPEAWQIIDGKLYLNYSSGATDQWEAGYEEYHAKAEANWPDIKARLERQ